MVVDNIAELKKQIDNILERLDKLEREDSLDEEVLKKEARYYEEAQREYYV